MALKPEELVLSAEEVLEADTIEIDIDNKLRQQFVSGKTCFVSAGARERIVHEIIRRYKVAGWKVKHDIYDTGESVFLFNQ